MKNQTITTELLISKGACDIQVNLFSELFGESVKVTFAGCDRVACKFNWDWAAFNLLPYPAQAAYEKATDQAWADQAWAAYKKAVAKAFARCVRKWGIAE